MTRFSGNSGWRWWARWWAGRRTELPRPGRTRLHIEGLQTRDLLSFHFAGSFPAGTSPAQVAVADVTGAGKADLLVSNQDGVALLRGNGDGTFRGPQTILTGAATSITVADLNHDGKPDLIAADASGLHVLLGNGDGTFRPGPSIPALVLNMGGEVTNAVTVADLNHDGKPDLILTSDSVSNGGAQAAAAVLLGNGDGTFQAPRPITTDGATSVVGVADLNGDGKLDLISTESLCREGGGFCDSPTDEVKMHLVYFGGTGGVAVADVNGDGKPDLISADPASGIVRVFLNGPNPSPPLFAIGGGNGHVQIHRAGDNALVADFAPYGAGAGNPQVKVYRGQVIAQGTFNPNNPDASLLTSFFAYGLGFNIGVHVAVGDLTGDGFADLVTGPTTGNPEVRVFDGKKLPSLNHVVNPIGSNLLAAWYAYGLNFNVGASVAIGDVQDTGVPNIITGATTGNPHVEVYQLTQSVNGTTTSINYANADSFKVAQFLAFDPNQNIGVSISAQDYESVGLVDIFTGAASGPAKYRVFRAPVALGQPQVQVAEGDLNSFPPGVTIGG